MAWAARHTGRALRWVETRSENLIGMTHGRAQQHSIKIGGTRDGRVLAYRLEVVQDTGAYPRMSGFLPTLTNLMAVGPYDIAHVEAGYRVVVTNTTPIAAYRGAGRPGGDGRDRAGDGPVRARDRHGPGRGAAQEPGAGRQVPVPDPVRGPLRQRRLHRGAGQGAGRRGLRGPAGRAGPPAGARGRGPARHRGGQLRGDHRGGRRQRRDRPGGGQRRRHGHGLHRQFPARPGPLHGMGDAGPVGPRASPWTRSPCSTATPT